MLGWLILIALAALGAFIMAWVWEAFTRVPGWDEPKDPAFGLKHPRIPPPSTSSKSEEV